MKLAGRQACRPIQNRESRNKTMHMQSVILQHGCQEHTMGKE